MAEHRWVKHTITDVTVLPERANDGNFLVVSDDISNFLADETAVYGCIDCDVSLAEGYETECPGPSTEEVSP